LWALLVGLTSLLVAGPSVVAQDADPAEQPTTTSAPASSDEGMAPQQLMADAIAEACAGHFDQAHKKLSSAAQAAPDEAQIDQALSLMDDYLKLRAAAEAQRGREYAEAVERVKRGMMVQAAVASGAKDELLEKLREKTSRLTELLVEVAGVETLRSATGPEARVLQTNSLEALRKARKVVGELQELLKEHPDEYTKVFGDVNDALAGRLTAFIRAWQEADLGTEAAIHSAAETLRDPQFLLAQALADVGVMVSQKPWRYALVQASLAKRLAADSDRIAEQDWFIQLKKDIETLGGELMAKAQWSDALVAWSSLEAQEEDHEHYKHMAKIATKHVRVVGLYGDSDGAGDETAEDKTDDDAATKPAAADKPDRFWQRMTTGIDAEMVRQMVSQVDRYYVTAVDYRKLIDEALTSIKVLAETPQVADSFEGLRDEDKRKAFCELLDKASAHFKQKTEPLDHLELLLALNNVLDASERTVRIPTGVLAMEFANGFLQGLDTFSNAVWPHDVPQFEKMTRGRFTGVGIQVEKDPGEPLRVVTPMAGTPAFRAGIKMGDLIVAVEGKATKDLPIEAVIEMIMGEEGAKVVLRIQRKGVVKPFDVTIVRAQINIRTVKGWRLLPSGDWDYLLDRDAKIGYVRLTRFTKQTGRDLSKALKAIRASGVESLVLDLRLNPGGLLGAAKQVTNEFVRDGAIVRTRGRQVVQPPHKGDWRGRFLRGDMVVLVDEYSASASEIVAGALQDMARATVVGRRTYGKGSVQQVLPVSRKPTEAFLKLTSAYFYVGPSEKLLHRTNAAEEWGVQPDIDVRTTPRQMKAWLDIRRHTDLIQEVDPQELAQDLQRQLKADLQLNAALLLLRLKQVEIKHTLAKR